MQPDLYFICPSCLKKTVIDDDWQTKMKNHLEYKYPARSVVVPCSCGEWTFSVMIRTDKV